MLLAFSAGARAAVDRLVEVGSMAAIFCSWRRNRSFVWMIVAAMLSWLYVLYFAITQRPNRHG
jgi:hypothetical protein